MLIRKTMAALALCAAGVATAGVGAASAEAPSSADVQPAEVVGSYPTKKECNKVGQSYVDSGKASGWSCTSWNGGRYELRIF
ncbi:hypothetical protein GCM10027271_52800 [Saccharopolyspora gloriosae]|uniref:Uncharacterized protein n=1 Tax=Saccharopolyspora gloriosae TaxID=455344 RepID=A0A840NK81_9PSEU|nr:hypothetical protein [Saccharopolyspora gloriosae]